MFILDGPLHPSGRPTLVYGARGILTLQLTSYGPKVPLHSGHYGNWVPNPAMRLAQLLATMKGDDGKVLIKGFYDGLPPLTAEEQAIIDGVPDDPAALQALFGIAGPERPGLKLQEALQYPSFNVRGLSSAFVGGEARTIIPATATAEIDVRLVKETPAARLHELVVAHIRAQGWHVVTTDPDDATRATYPKIVKVIARGDGTNAYRTSPLLPISKQVVSSMQEVFGAPPVQIRTSGGTVPIAPFIEALGFPAISVPNVNFDNNQHGENENLRLGHFFRAITTMAALLDDVRRRLDLIGPRPRAETRARRKPGVGSVGPTLQHHAIRKPSSNPVDHQPRAQPSACAHPGDRRARRSARRTGASRHVRQRRRADADPRRPAADLPCARLRARRPGTGRDCASRWRRQRCQRGEDDRVRSRRSTRRCGCGLSGWHGRSQWQPVVDVECGSLLRLGHGRQSR